MTQSAQIRLFLQSQIVLFSFLFLAGAHAAEIVSFSPSGEVKGVRQVTARFSSPMVTFGDPRELSPFSISCNPTDVQQGNGRWADMRNWVYDFAQDLPAGVHCEFKLKPDLKTLKGESISGTKDFSFTTGGPAIVQTEPYEGSVIAEDQIFLIAIDIFLDGLDRRRRV